MGQKLKGMGDIKRAGMRINREEQGLRDGFP